MVENMRGESALDMEVREYLREITKEKEIVLQKGEKSFLGE